MEVASFVTTVMIGLVVGAFGWFLVADGRNGPVWPAIVLGVIAAVIGMLIARVVGVARSPAINWLELTFQLSVAAAGVDVLARVSRRRRLTSTRRSVE